jgi:hypothetical protein
VGRGGRVCWRVWIIIWSIRVCISRSMELEVENVDWGEETVLTWIVGWYCVVG